MPGQIIDATKSTHKRYQCRHIFTDGRRCGSPCLRGEEFCYYHHTTRRPVEKCIERNLRMSTFVIPLPEDRHAIQASIAEVLQRIATCSIDTKRAGLLLYGLQIASSNLPRVQQAPPETPLLEEIVADPCLGYLAPRTEIVMEGGERREEMLSTPAPVAQDPHEAERLQSEASEPEEPPTHLFTHYGLRNDNGDFTIPRESVFCKHVNPDTPCPAVVSWDPPPQNPAQPEAPEPIRLPNLQATAAEPQNRVPHLRDGRIVAKVGEAEQFHPETSGPLLTCRLPHPQIRLLQIPTRQQLREPAVLPNMKPLKNSRFYFTPDSVHHSMTALFLRHQQKSPASGAFL